MWKKPTFPEPGCWECPAHAVAGKFPVETRYCMAKSRAGRRMRASDPVKKPPKWCPKRLKQKICRIYRLRGEGERALERLRAERADFSTTAGYSAMPHRYASSPVLEMQISLTARQMYEQLNEVGADEILEGFKVELGDIVELDDGLRPYAFFCFTASSVVPALGFWLSNPQPPERR